MPFFENILLFYNDQFSGIKSEVIQLVRKNQAKLKIIDVFDNLDQYYELLPPSISIDELKELIISERRQEIIGHFEAYPDIKGQMTVIFKFGNPVVEIIKEAIRGAHDLVIKAASGKQNLYRIVFLEISLLSYCENVLAPFLSSNLPRTHPFKKYLPLLIHGDRRGRNDQDR